ncbi:inositol monophosphatase family protein [Sphingomonas arenae]|uniref:inositol monophosphatase family protein n=1 Tax=Sphingomonas arenae TaxID=2812555 RepID=UPI0019682725|nr:inositol monophosphatase family protein [Sphingomonas arenae]
MPDLAFFQELSAAARAVTLGAAVPVAENKAGEGAFDPVTHLDRAAEQALRAAIERRFPSDGIEGEEFGLTRADAKRRWSLDPIDGTRALICGLPSWTTLVALLDGSKALAGMIDAPVLDELALGLEGRSLLISSAGIRPLQVSSCSVLGEARLATTDPFLFDEQQAIAFDRVRRAAPVTRYGLDALAYARLAAGSLDLVIESGLKPHDYNALVPVVRGAGGVIGNWQGGADLSGGDVIAAATPALFEEALKLLRN